MLILWEHPPSTMLSVEFQCCNDVSFREPTLITSKIHVSILL